MKPISELIRIRLIELRKEANLPQWQVADFAKITKSAYASYEEGRAAPGIDTLLNFTKLYCLSGIDELIFGRREMKNNLVDRYRSLPIEKRKIVDFIMTPN